MSIKYIYFDLADTLIVKEGLFFGIQNILHSYSYARDIRTIQRAHYTARSLSVLPDRPNIDFYRNFNKIVLSQLNILDNINIISNNIIDMCLNLKWKTFDDSFILGNLMLPYGLISNWDKNIHEVISELLPYNFSHVLCSELVGLAKPDIKFYEKAISLAGVMPFEILYIGDSLHLDIVPAASIGITSVLLDRDHLYDDYIGLKVNSLNDINLFLTLGGNCHG